MMQEEEENKPSKKAEEPAVSYKRTITFFQSFQDQEEFERKKTLSLSPEERIEKLEKMRKFF